MQAAVPLPPAEAFDLFTTRMSSWWPLQTHSVFTGDSEAVVFESFAGGRVIERSRTGQEHVWAEIVAYDRPRRFVLAWHPGGGPATEVEVAFTPSDDGTLVELEHRGWEVFEKPEAARDEYANGWPLVFGERFIAAASRAEKES